MKMGDKIKKLREMRGLTQRELASRANIAFSGLADIESGKVKNPGYNTVEKLAEVLRVSIEYFSESATRTPFDMDDLAVLLTDEMAEFIKSREFMPYLLLSREAAEKGVSPETLRHLLLAIRQTMEQEMDKTP